MKLKYLFGALAPVFFLFFSCKSQQHIAAKKQHKYMENTYAEIKRTVSEAEVTILNDTLKVLFPENLLFKNGSSSISETTYPIMKRFADALIVYSQTHILVNGHTDNTGEKEMNNALSKSRADSAAAVLMLYKVPASRLEFWGFGSRQPIADNSTAEGRTKNRRVEFIILYKQEE
jgi:outer membrane protein OmpA-like peptidoglycan-associated protein